LNVGCVAGVSLVSHLPPYHDPNNVFSLVGPTLQLSPSVAASVSDSLSSSAAPSTATISSTHNLHPAVLQLGHDYATHAIRGGNARCRAMLHCFRALLLDYQPVVDGKVDIRQALLHDLFNPAFSFWTHHCRPHSVSMGNAYSFVKHAVASLDRNITAMSTSVPTGTIAADSNQHDEMASSWLATRNVLLDTLEQYERERLEYAGRAIAELAAALLVSSNKGITNTKQQGEVFLTFGYSEAVAMVVTQLAKQQRALTSSSVRFIVVDSRPQFSGKQMLQTLRREGMQCSYILLNALSYVLQDVTKVLLGASALMSDGSLLGQIGSGCVALAAHMHRIPVLVCCETYKISNKLYLESITHNELGSPEELNIPVGDHGSDAQTSRFTGDGDLKKLHLKYDLTPAEFVSGIVTELGVVPATSVAVLLREMNLQDSNKYDD
jgi:translation initiation factor eIF-2B subunit delta